MATAVIPEVLGKAKRAKQAAARLALLSRAEKDCVLLAMAAAIEANVPAILEANARDVRQAEERKLSAAPIDRLVLDDKRVEGMAAGLRDIARLTDPVGEVITGWRAPNGLEISKVRVPLGVIGIIYESRPNVTVDAAGLCLKAGNAVVLRGGKEANRSNIALATVIAQAATASGVPQGAIELIESTDRAAVMELMRLTQYVDCLIPRGGAGLIKSVLEHAQVPVIETGVGNCHVYVDESADLEMATEIVFNAKCQRPGICNALETLLVHQAVAACFLPLVAARLEAAGVELRGDERTCELLPQAKAATEEDWATEYLALILAVAVMDDLDAAVEHIARWGTKHSEAIVTSDYAQAQRFAARVDAAAVYVNASTRFTDGGQFGMGGEIGISTQKLHARGPMGLEELTSYKYVVYGEGQVRP